MAQEESGVSATVVRCKGHKQWSRRRSFEDPHADLALDCESEKALHLS